MDSRESFAVTVLLFGPLRERVGEGTLTIRLPPGSTTRELLDQLAEAYAPVWQYRAHVRLAVNGAYTPADAPLHAHDEVALITPTSGG